jgi:peptidoglycan/LPS O-acetylase OafA/YrhL
MRETGRRRDLEAAKGCVILLVVFGHIVARADPAGVAWYEPLRRGVYAFHMPFFLYLSGLVAVYSGAVLRPDLRALAQARAWRLLLPFFGLGLLVVAGKVLASRFVYVDHAPADFARGVQALFWDTGDSPAQSVWYLFVLFTVTLASAVVLRGRPARFWWLLGGAVALFLLPFPALVYADRVGTYAIFFVLGVGAGLLGARWDGFLASRWWWLAAAGFVISDIAVFLGGGGPEKLTLLTIGTLSMPFVHGLLTRLPIISTAVFLWLGRYCFMIYLGNTIFIGLAKGVLLHFVSWDGAHFLPFAAALMASGVFGPVALKQAVFRQFRVLDRLTD